MKSIANFISLTRIVLSFSLLFTEPLGAAFFIIYLLCGASDFLDGYIARKTATTSSLGERLDSAADLIMVAVVLYIFIPLVEVTAPVLAWIAAIAFVRIASMAVVFVKYRVWGVLHTYGNKATGLLLLLFPVLLGITNRPLVLISALCFVASLSALEELLINLTSKRYDANIKTIAATGEKHNH